MAELRAVVMRADLERLGVFDEQRVRRRFLDSFAPTNTRVIIVDGIDRGLIAVRWEPHSLWIEHFYLAPDLQGLGIGGSVLAAVIRETSTSGLPLRLNVLQGSPARRLYERHGFRLETEDPIDVYLMRPSHAQRAG